MREESEGSWDGLADKDLESDEAADDFEEDCPTDTPEEDSMASEPAENLTDEESLEADSETGSVSNRWATRAPRTILQPL